MSTLGLALLLAYIVAAPVMIYLLRGVRGVVITYAVGWLLLSPRAGYAIPGLPNFTKDFAIAYGVLLGVLMFRTKLITSFRPHIIDLLMGAWLVTPFFSSLTNGFGPWDGMSEFYGQVFTWGVPYLIGRGAIRNLDDVRQVAEGLLISGLIAVPFALWEIRMSPQLHLWVYGERVAGFHASKRLGGYRPTIMFRHGLETGIWMATSSAVALWYLLTIRHERMGSIPKGVLSSVLLVTTVMCRSLGSLALLFGAAGAALLTRSTKVKLALLALVLTPPLYISVRVAGVWSPEVLADIAESAVGSHRADSFRARLYQEELLSEKAMRKPLFGWGGHNNSRVFTDRGEKATSVDGQWTIAIGQNGLLGLSGLFGALCVPGLLVIVRTPAQLLTHRNMASVVGLLLAVGILACDLLLNAFSNPVIVVCLGALTSAAVMLPGWLPRGTPAHGPPPGSHPDEDPHERPGPRHPSPPPTPPIMPEPA